MRASLFGLAALFVACAPSAHAGISAVNMFRNDSYLQTGNGNTLSVSGSFFSVGLMSTNPNDFSSVQLTYPGPGSPVNLSQTNPTTFAYQTGFLANQAAMDAAYPFGTYVFSASGGATTSFSYSGDAYPLSLPYLAGTNYSDLQGMNSAAPFAFQFSPFVTGNVADSSNIFFTIFDFTTNTFVYDQNFLPSSTTGLLLPAHTLQPGQTYGYELIFDNRLLNLPSPGAVFEAQIGFDLRGDGTFTTAPAAVPEPASLLLLVPGCLLTGWFAVRQRGRLRRPLPA